MKTLPAPARRFISATLLLVAVVLLALFITGTSSSRAQGKRSTPVAPSATASQVGIEAIGLDAFRAAVGEVSPVVIELKKKPGVLRKIEAEKAGQPLAMEQLFAYALDLVRDQDAFRGKLAQHGVRALMRETDVRQIDGSIRHIEYRFTYLLNGFVAYVATADLEKLRALPEVAYVSVADSPTYSLDKAIDYSLGTQTAAADRRLAVYGPTQEFSPDPSDPNHPEAPFTSAVDGFEGQNLYVAIIDSGVDWRHPMFGGSGVGVVNGMPRPNPTPRVSGQPETAGDNKKVVYYYALSSPGDLTDDFGHGTLVASCAAGYSVDNNTAVRNLYGTGRDGTGVSGPLNGQQHFGTAPQARILAYKVCGPANACAGDIPLAVEDAASPFTLVASGDPGPTPVAKPVADVINLSLSSTAGDSAAANSRAVNNAALAGVVVVASAGNAGPGLGTIGNPSAATMAISVAANLDPGSVAGSDVLEPKQIPAELCDDMPRPPTCDTGTQPAGPPPEEGASSNSNAPRTTERQGMRIFPVAGGGALPVEDNPGDPAINTGSLSAHYVFVDQRGTPPLPNPPSVTNRIAVVKFSGAFGLAANRLVPSNPSAILLITTVESATAVAVVNGIPTFTIHPDDGDYLLDLLSSTDDDTGDPAHGAVSELPIRLAETISLTAFQGVMAGFSSRGPNDHPNARFRTVKPDVSGPGVGVHGAATVEGIPDDTVGLASTTGYTTANGTSFSAPITAGAMTLIRQRVREELNLDSIDQMDPNYRAKRFETVTVSRALLQNTATNLRDGFGVPAIASASINDMGSGHINIAEALRTNAIMVSPTQLLTDPTEYDPPPPEPLFVHLPTASFGAVPVVNLNGTVTRTREVIIRDVGLSGAGAGTYNLSVEDNRLPAAGFDISFLAADGVTPITSVAVPPAGQTSFFVKVVADGTQITADPTEIQWYVKAVGAGYSLRMPFYFRAVAVTLPNITSPNQTAPTGTEEPPVADCPVDTTGDYAINWNYSIPGGGPTPVGFRVQEGTRSDTVFFDPADEPLAGGANSQWTGSAQWTTSANPDTGSPAYFIPDAANQNESLTMINAVALPPGGATLSFDTTQETELDFDFAHVEISTDGVSFITLASFSGSFTGTRFIDISPYAGQSVRIRFRMTSDLAVPAPGWWVENIRLSSDDFATIAETGPGATSLPITAKPSGTYTYRIAGLFADPNNPGLTLVGPYSNTQCVTVDTFFEGVVSRKTHGGAGAFDIDIGGPSRVECRSGGSSGDHQVIFTFAGDVASVGSVQVTGSSGNPMVNPNGTGIGPGTNQFTVNLTGVPNASSVTVTLNNVQSTGADSVAVAQAILDALVGDVSGNSSVNATDVALAKSQSGNGTTMDNFRADVTVNGAINSSDVGLIKANSGTMLPQSSAAIPGPRQRR